MSTHLRFTFVGAALLAVSSYAQAEEILIKPQCQQLFGSTYTRCSLATTEIAKSPGFEADFVITYSFPCKGHRTNFSFQTDLTTVAIDYSDTAKTIRMLGNSSLKVLDAESNQTYRATLSGECTIKVQSIDISPSVIELERWKAQAVSVAEDIQEAFDSWHQIKDCAQVIDWDREHLIATRNSLEEELFALLGAYGLTFDQVVYPLDYADKDLRGLVKREEDQSPAFQQFLTAHYAKIDALNLLSQVKAILEGQTPIVTKDAVAGRRAHLESKIDLGEFLVTRADAWQKKFSLELKKIQSTLVEKLADAKKHL